MSLRALPLLILLACSTVLSGQTPAPPRAEATAAQPSTPLPVRRVVLYKTGVGYFEHLGTVRDSQDIAIRFTSAQLDDVLKTLTAIDLGKGQVTSISYNSVAPLERRLGALRLPVDEQTTMVQLLTSLRGARVEVSSGATAVAGRLLSVEHRSETRGTQVVNVQVFSIMTDSGEMRTFELSPSVRVRLAERDLRLELGRYLDVLGSTREQDVRNMVISTSGAGERRLFVSYISEVPIWKSSYRLVIPKSGRPLLQGWAVVDNTIGEDWRNVELSLVAGAPQSFIQQISQPYYGQRPVVPLPRNVSMEPQTHGSTLAKGATAVSGTIRDASGSVLPGAMVRLIGPDGEVARTVSDQNGHFQMAGPSGSYTLSAELAGFRPWSASGVELSGGPVTTDIAMSVGSLSESVNVTMDGVNRALGRGGRGRPGGVVGGMVGGLAEAPPPPPAPPAMPRMDAIEAYDAMRQGQAAAAAQELGDLFEYRIKEPVSLLKNQSALVPIVNAEITAERVSLWKRTNGSGRPLRALWLTNTTGLTLDGGSMTIIEGEAFGGEGLVEPLKPKERRLVSYASDLGVLVNATTRPIPQRIARLRVREGYLVQDTEERSTTTYEVRNEGTTPVTLVIEHPMDQGWKLAPDAPKAEESTPGAERFRVVVDPGKETKLAVPTSRAGTARIALGSINEAMIAQLVASGASAEELERAMRPLLEKQNEIAAVDRRTNALEMERRRIVEDQARLRENMKALRGSAEEKQLLQRYTRQLDEQESRLAVLQQETSKATTERAALVAELSRLISTLSFEWSGDPR
jgi:hypothetical protein